MIVYLGNQKLNTIYSGDKEMLTTPLLPEELTIEYIVVGGGGASGGSEFNTGGSGGGGGGGVISGSLTIAKRGVSYPVIVGRGGRPTAGVTGSNGENGLTSSFYTFAVAGGGGGAKASGSVIGLNFKPSNGNDGANGGGAAFSGSGGLGIVGQGFNGGNGSFPSAQIAGGGAGAGGAGNAAGPGSSGSGSRWLDGLEYAIGGCGDGSSICRNFSGSGKALYGNGAAGTVNNPPNSGSNGVVIVRYPGTGSQLIGGDTVYFSGSYTYHRFSTVGTSSLYY